MLLSSVVLGSYIREATLLPCAAWFAQSQRRFLFWMVLAHAYYNLYSFRDSANGVFLFRQVAPAPCSPPLGGSGADSAVRFTPAVKYGGRENKLSRRETGCMSGHPCRAHHKLKWARKMQSIVKLLYEHLSLSESDKDSTQFAHGLSKGARQPYQWPHRKTAHQKWIAQ